MSEAPPLSISGFGHGYGAAPVLADVSLEIAGGEVVAVLGESGCGKSTLLRAVAGLVTPDAGSIRVCDRDVVRDGRELVAAEHRGVGLVFQDYALFPNLTVRDNVAFGIDQGGRARVDECLALVGLAGHGERLPHQLSGGQQQRVALARALAPRPRILALDEPFANVDGALRQQLAQELQLVVRETGVSALFVTHLAAEALAIADRVAVLVASGDAPASIAQCDAPRTVYARPASRAVARLTGPATFVRARAGGGHAETPLGRVALVGSSEGDVDIVARPHEVSFEPGRSGDARVVVAQFCGQSTRLVCETPIGQVEVDVDSASAVATGDVGRVTLGAGTAGWMLTE